MRKKILFLGVLLLVINTFTACDYILKPRQSEKTTDTDETENVILSPTNDANNCASTAGYRWSVLRDNCIRILEHGYRLVPALAKETVSDDDEIDLAMINAYLIFNSDKTKAEIFIGTMPNSIILDRLDENLYVFEKWKLQTLNGYILTEDDIEKFVSPLPVEKQIEGSLEYSLTDAIIAE